MMKTVRLGQCEEKGTIISEQKIALVESTQHRPPLRGRETLENDPPEERIKSWMFLSYFTLNYLFDQLFLLI